MGELALREGHGLSDGQLERLHTLESDVLDAIEEGRIAARAMASCLEEINRDGLYKAHAETFAGYCKAAFGIGKSHAYRLIAFSETLAIPALSGVPIGDILTENHVRPVADLPKKDRARVIKRAAHQANKLERPLTHKDVKTAREDLGLLNVVEAEEEQARWERWAEMHKRWLADLTAIKKGVNEICDDPRGQYLDQKAPRIAAALRELRAAFSYGMPVGEEEDGSIKTRMDERQ